ncbi:hypothetical protein OG372_14455 [Streptomyces sp. NBC_01020]|uniref:hypothetical protein n=1 Tax=Streptomyces sp. NBC_01020 TaxID=2903722 RepID=UPI00386F3BFB|nr:hypothetical protein OG372_14455 [Streptomyces sp. NBC_01020]
MTAHGRTQLAHDERLLPTPKMRSDEQLIVLRAACASTDSFVDGARLAVATGLDKKKCGLVPAFLFSSGLLEAAGGHFSRYRPTSKGRVVADAWEKGEEAGFEALRSVWKGRWFARAIKERLGYGPVPRDGLVARLLTKANADKHRMRQAEILLDLLVAIGMVIPDGDGYMSWHEGACHQTDESGASSSDASQLPPRPGPYSAAPLLPEDLEMLNSNPLSGPSPRDARRMPPPEGAVAAQGAHVPSPRNAPSAPPRSEPSADPYADVDLLALLCPPVLLADLARLDKDEVMALHDHLRGLAALTAKLRGRPVS